MNDQTATRLEAAAERLGLTPLQLLEISSEEKLARLGKDFLDAAKYVLKKNAELYDRLS